MRATLTFVALLAMTILLAGLSLHTQYQSETRLVAGQYLKALKVAYLASIETYELDVATRFRLQIHRPEVLALLDRARTTTAADLPRLRGQLYRLLRPDYEDMRRAGLRQLHFHLPDGRSLLRFHRPELVDDLLFDIRPSVRIANAERHLVRGLETGRTLSGFRYVFPIEQDGRHLGSVELSISFERIHENIMRLLPEGEYAFLLHRPGIEASIDATQREKYADTNVHPDYLTEHPTISRVTRDFIASPTARALDPLLRQNEEVQSRMAAGETFALPLLYQGRGHVAAFVAIPDVEGRQSAYVVGYSEATAITDLHTAMLRQGALALLLILLLALAIWLTLRRGRLLRESEQRFRHLFDTAPMPLCLVSGDGIIKDANTRFDRLFRYAPLDVRTLAEWWQFACPDPERRQEAVLAWNTALQRARATSSDIEPIEQRVRCRDGCECSMLISGTPIGDETLMTFFDITERREYERRLERIAHYDPLTGILNRSLLGDRLHQAVAHARRRGSSMALCYLDLDGFKEINDTHGHATGDDLLVEIARRLKECLREGDTLARLGGDEFVAVLVDLEDFADCERVLRRMLQVVETPVPHANGALRVSVSIGVTLFPGDDADPDTLLRHGDQAMYEAKRAGRNRYHLFDPAREGLNPSHPGAADGGRPIKPIEE